jgi:hypothetical protein
MATRYKVLGLKQLVNDTPIFSSVVKKFTATQTSLELALNKLAEEGYELVQISPGYGDSYVVLKRSE